MSQNDTPKSTSSPGELLSLSEVIGVYGDTLRGRENSFVTLELSGPGALNGRSRLLHGEEGFHLTAPFKHAVPVTDAGALPLVRVLEGTDPRGIPTERIFEFIYGYCYAFALAGERELGLQIEVMHGVHHSEAKTGTRTVLHAWLLQGGGGGTGSGGNGAAKALDATGVHNREGVIREFLAPGYLDAKIERISHSDLWQRCKDIPGGPPLLEKVERARELLQDMLRVNFFR